MVPAGPSRGGRPRAAARSGLAVALPLVVTPGDPAALSGALGEVLGSAPEAEELAAAGRRRAAAFDMEVLVDRYEEIYRNLLDGVAVDRSAPPTRLPSR